MKGLRFTSTSLVLLPLLTSFSDKAKPVLPKSPDRPNVIIMIADQWRGNAIGCLGIEPVKTPNLDRLAGEGVIFTSSVSNYPVSSPSRAMLMTGMYPTQTNVRENCTSQSGLFDCELPEKKTCWSDILHQDGYDLGYIGKWHLDTPYKPFIKTSNNSEQLAWNEWTPPERRHGFNYWLAYGTYDNHMKPMYWNTTAKREEFHYVNQWGPEFEVDNAMQYIKNEKGSMRDSHKPFGLVVSMNPPHTDYNQVPQKYKEIYKNVDVEDIAKFPDIPAKGTKMGDHYRNNIKNYYACMSGVDDQVGRLMKFLKDNGLDDNTIVVFLSDHGDCLGMHEEITKNNVFEESMRIPLIIRYPHKIRPQKSDILISVPDITATILDLAGDWKQAKKSMDGVSYKNLLETGKGKKPESQLYFKMCYYADEDAKPEDAKIKATDQMEQRGLRTERYTFVMRFAKHKLYETVLYDRLKDPYELHNVASENPIVVNTLKKETIKKLTGLKDWMAPFIM
jgi:arylsulfatase A-like enzyme